MSLPHFESPLRSSPAYTPLNASNPDPLDHNTSNPTNSLQAQFPSHAPDRTLATAYGFPQPNERPWAPYMMPNYQSMDSAALIAAALVPEPLMRTDGHVQSMSTHIAKNVQSATISSPLTELSDHDFSTETERRADGNTHARKRRLVSRPAAGKYAARNRTIFLEDDEDVSLGALHEKRSSYPAENLPNSEISEDESDIELVQPRFKSNKPPKTARRTRRLIRKKPHGTRVPQTLDDANEADQMLWHWKNTGRNWEEIRQEWCRITGIIPGPSTLSVRYIKLNENFARHGAAGDRELLRFRKEAEDELMARLWERVAEKMKAYSDLSEYNPKDLKKRYDALVRSSLGSKRKKDSESVGELLKTEVEDENDETSQWKNLQCARPMAVQVHDKIDAELASPDFGGLPTNISTVAERAVTARPSDASLTMQDTISLNTSDTMEGTIPVGFAAAANQPIGQDEQIIIVEDEPCADVLPALPASDLSLVEGSSAPLASSPFLRSLVAYVSEDE